MVKIKYFVNLLLMLYIAGVLAYRQSDYNIIHHRVELISSNVKYLYNTQASLVPFNRTTRALNITFGLKVDLQNSILISLQAYKFASNEYRLFPFLVNTDYCKIRENNLFGFNDMALYSNITSCPIKKGYYIMNKYRPDEKKFPPYLVPGDFKAVLNFTYESYLLAEAHWYGSIKKIEKLWE